MADREEKLDDAISDVLAAAAILEIIESHLDRNARACGVDGTPFARRYCLMTNETLALDHAMNSVILAANKLRNADNTPREATHV